MPLPSGTRLGPYEILAPLGAGGMGEVYRARDTRLGREVAIKVLAGHRIASPEIRARFEREAKTISSFNHPHICTLFDVGREGDTDYLVMELVEGETLATRIARGALPPSQVLEFGAQIADALDRAHRAGVIHRDLKPANVMLTKNGAKLMDFGLARATRPGGPASGSGATAPMPLTEEGTIVGTFQYMAPEQLEGKEADARTDLWALGCVLHEMATGQRAFSGSSQASLIGAIMHAEPRPLGELAPMSPPGLDRLVHECLMRDPEERRQSARDLARELRAIGMESAPGAVRTGRLPRRSAWLERAAWVALVALVASFSAARFRGEPSASRSRVVSSIAAPPGTILGLREGAAALSPNGLQLAVVARDSAGVAQLWVRALDSDQPRPLSGTEGAMCPFWSPDGRSIGFFGGGKLKRVDISGGAPLVLADVDFPRGGTWSRAGFILYSPARRAPIMRVAATGGEPATVDSFPRGAMAEGLWPVLLPDGRHFLMVSEGVARGGSFDGLYLHSVDRGSSPRLLVSGAKNGIYVRPGWLFFWRDGGLWAQSFDAGRLRLEGEAIRVADRVVFDAWLGCALFSASDGGTLVYQRGGTAQLSELLWVNRAGDPVDTFAPEASYYAPRLSHDTRRVAVDRSDPISGEGDIWVYDVGRKLGERITSAPENETAPVWSADDTRLFWMTAAGARGIGDIHSRSVAGSDREEIELETPGMSTPLDCTPDGRSLLISTRSGAPAAPRDLALVSLADHTAAPWLATPFDEGRARLSSDGRWVAYVSDQSGQAEVYVQRFPNGGGRVRVSTSGGGAPIWRRDGRELFFVAESREILSVTFGESATGAPEVGTPVLLFRTLLRPSRLSAEFDVSPDGQRFLVNRMMREAEGATITLVQGWRPPK